MRVQTTLMDVLADRKTAGRQEGRVTVNGFDKEPGSFARVMGYCEQFDTHSSGTTVEEAIRTSATLRLSKDISPEQVCSSAPVGMSACRAPSFTSRTPFALTLIRIAHTVSVHVSAYFAPIFRTR